MKHASKALSSLERTVALATTLVSLAYGCASDGPGAAGDDVGLNGASGDSAGTNEGTTGGSTGTSGITTGATMPAAAGGAAGSSSPGVSGSGGSAGKGGGTSMGGAGGSGGATRLDGGVFVGPTCASASAKFPTDAPQLTTGIWKDISPKGPKFGWGAENVFVQGMAIDPCNPATIYVTVSGFNSTTFATVVGGLFRSTDAGSTWTTVGPFDQPINVRVDPKNPLHMYVGDGVRGSTTGFWVTADGGKNWVVPSGFKTLSQSLNDTDVYHVEPDPADFNHVLLSFHWNWHNCDDFGFGACTSGVAESTDGGTTFVIHDPNPGWAGAGGYDVFFLYNPALDIGDKNTWLFGTQGKGYWRTADGGKTWNQVTTQSMTHGGGQIYYTSKGTLYASSDGPVLRSTDNGVTWTSVGTTKGTTSVFGDGKYVYAHGAYANIGGPFSVSLETDGAKWSAFNAQSIGDGPFEMAFDSVNGILYSSSWGSGLWALQTAR
jgi:hypothetical protein